jgi:hypothetical protein
VRRQRREESRARRRATALVLTVVLTACVPPADGQKVYGSVAFALKAASTQIVLSDGWSFTLEHYFAIPRVSLGPVPVYGVDAGACSSSPEERSGDTLVDYVLGTTFDVNAVVPDNTCTVLTIDPLSFQSDGLGTDPGVSAADLAAYVGGSEDFLPTAFIVGTATRAGEAKRVSLRFGGEAGPAVSDPFDCSPLQSGAPVALGVADVRKTFHFAFDLASLFPGSPPQFGPIADTDSNQDGVVTIDELGPCLEGTIALQIETGWQLAPEDGTCEKESSEAGVPAETCSGSGVP